ncbi:DUF6934 family protein [Dyadobacter sp. MSC1_007]|jgi:hypothetical protein|uniref:DUF6934 family protein n=1 Tax=Dyadobacter sp. MSC1_007 TaxID=2909264 RepID=UPI00202DECBB|nr:hypothetical protein [Dyadobacter sp. MSC1_007]
MDLESYPVKSVNEKSFKFSSEGKNGVFELRVLFDFLGINQYNLVFGVWDPVLKRIEDSIELRNGDMDKILSTVAKVAINFLWDHPNANIFATGRIVPGKHATRTRKYQISINKHLTYLMDCHNIYGFTAERDATGHIIGTWPFGWSGSWDRYNPNNRYDAFLLNLK